MSERKAKLVSITIAWEDGSSLVYAPKEWDEVDHLIVAVMMKMIADATDY